ncbi:unnamed protein product [Acanthoscelides obtectus]|uniref:Uncharacterized protein n=1 Tax=Acanthoscelides obtectus TaxID=200917 RepID=A0A9P0K277_ACAOB|nr:unnamed protein product [Acanthoscelides obtectus]CAK1632620.1 hypothetical protein AOBTE_LOCUS7651 [Acanthoscelides obtectus]
MTTSELVVVTPPKTNQPSSPREFFQKIYGDLDKKPQQGQPEDLVAPDPVRKPSSRDLVAPIPVLATPLPFILPHGDTQLAAAAAGLSAFSHLLATDG